MSRRMARASNRLMSRALSSSVAPVNTTVPWKGTITYLPITHTEWEERVCAENVLQYYVGEHYFSDKDARLPTADKPDF